MLAAEQAKVTRIAMWSGPRNLSTTLMRSWGARPDAFVTDEPLYAHYLRETGDRRHPGFDETLAAHDADWRRIAEWLTGSVPRGRRCGTKSTWPTTCCRRSGATGSMG